MRNLNFNNRQDYTNKHNRLLKVGMSVMFAGSDDKALIIGFGEHYGKTWVAFDNEEFGEHDIDAEDIIPIQ